MTDSCRMLIQEPTMRFDLSTLRENALLDTKQEAFARATISSTRDLIAGLDAKIRDTENALAELHKQRDAAHETMAIHVALLAPVRRLPSEVLGEIFQQCVPIEPTHETPFDSRDAPLLLTRICHRWRQVAQGTPQLWTNLVLYGHRTSEAFFSSIWFNNSGSLSLDISVKIRPDGWRSKRVPDQTLQMVVEQLSRIRKLSLVCVVHQLRDFFPRDAMATLPSLQELCVKPIHNWDANRTSYSFHNIFTPRLQTLVLLGSADLLLPALECTSNLRNLDIRGNCPLELFVDFLSRCPALQRIDAFQIDVKYPPESMDIGQIILSELSHLGLEAHYDFAGQSDNGLQPDDEDWSRRTKPLERLRAPNLQCAEISLPNCGHFLSSFMADSQSRLRTLTILNAQLDASTFNSATSIFTAVERMKFFRCDSSSGFWESLIHAEDTTSRMWTFPNLKSLLLEAVQFKAGHEAGFIQFLERRALPMRSQGQPPLEGIPVCYLEEIELNRCALSTETFDELKRLREGPEGFSITMKGESFAKDEAIES